MHQPLSDADDVLKGLRSGFDEGDKVGGELRSSKFFGGEKGIWGHSGHTGRVGGDWGGGK